MSAAPAPQPDRPGPAPRFTDPRVHANIMQALRSGTSMAAAARHARVAVRSLFEWRSRGEQAAALEDNGVEVPASEQPYLQMFRDMEQAQAQAAVRVSALAHQHAESDPTTARWLLERLDRTLYRLENRVEVSGRDGAPVQVQAAHVHAVLDTSDQEKADAFLQALAEAGTLDVPQDGRELGAD